MHIYFFNQVIVSSVLERKYKYHYDRKKNTHTHTKKKKNYLHRIEKEEPCFHTLLSLYSEPFLLT